ncbi:MAG TPA: competence/damage-inducible protein A [Actinomycetota bacterium]
MERVRVLRPCRTDQGGGALNAEIIGVGTELLLGQIANTNAQRISAALATIGVDVFRHGAVGDNLDRVVDVIRESAARSDAVIVTGGLGPTPDDLTREAVAAAFDAPLERDPELAEWIKEVFERLGRAMPEDNLRQADRPRGALSIPAEGTAPGFWIEHDGCILFALPGVPWEMEAMLTKNVLPELRARSGDAATVSKQILVAGLGESHTHQKIADIVDAQSNPTIAYLAGGGVVRVRLTAKASSDADAIAVIRPVEEQIRGRLGEAALPGNHGTVAEALAERLRETGITIAAAESLTGGLIGAELTAAGGSSDLFRGSAVCYTTEAKRDVVGVAESILMGPGAVSEEAAAALAEGAAKLFGADLGVSATGVAGPSEQEGKPVGTVYVGASFGGRTEVRQIRGYGDRDNIRTIAMNAALELGRRALAGA